jgi:hypothetical protein
MDSLNEPHRQSSRAVRVKSAGRESWRGKAADMRMRIVARARGMLGFSQPPKRVRKEGSPYRGWRARKRFIIRLLSSETEADNVSEKEVGPSMVNDRAGRAGATAGIGRAWAHARAAWRRLISSCWGSNLYARALTPHLVLPLCSGTSPSFGAIFLFGH